MLSSLRAWTALAVIAGCLVAGAGCKKKSRDRSYSSSSDTFNSDSFPGKPVGDGNVADDKRAFSPSGTDVILGSIKCTPNGSRGTMMVTYGVRTFPGGPETLIAQAYDGDTWTPPVSLLSDDATFTAGLVSYSGITHAWLNTNDHPADAAQDRDGDCLILWSVRDADQDGVTLSDGLNRTLNMTYFNSRQADEPGLRHGFQEFATRLSTQDEAGEDVTSFGVATDGLCGEARWTTNANAYSYGDDTTGIVVFWNQREENDGGGGFDDRALYARHIALDAVVDADLPLTIGAGVGPEVRVAIAGLGGSDSGTSSEETQVDHQFVSYNGFVAFRVCADNATAGDDVPSLLFDPGESTYNGTLAAGEDAALEAVTFDLSTGAASSAVVLHDVTPVTSGVDTLQNNADFLHRNLLPFATAQQYTFGPDEGLAVIVMLNAETDNDTNASQADVADTTGIGISEIDVVTGALLSHDLVNDNDAGISDFIDSRLVSARISRNGDYVWVAWLQREDAAASADFAVWAAQYLTTRPDGDGLFTLPPLTDSVSAPVVLNADVDGVSVASFAFQAGLGYICGAQSDPDVMNVAIAHADLATDRLLVARLGADLVVPLLPVTTVSVLETDDLAVYSLATQINDSGLEYRIIDSGEGGNVFAAYNADVDTTPGTDIRIFAERTGLGAGSVPVDSNVLFRQAGHQGTTLVGTPAGNDIGRFDPVTLEDEAERAHGYEQIHVIFREQESSEFSGLGLALRTRVFDTDDTTVAFGDSFVPGAGTVFSPPFDLDLPFLDPPGTEDANLVGTAVEGDRVSVYFLELGHIYAQEYFRPNDAGDLGWLNDDGASNPWLVDDDEAGETDSAEPVSFFQLFVVRSCTCDTIQGATVFYTKTADDFSSAERFHVRTHD